MALFGLFGGDKPTTKNIAKLVPKVKERYAQPEYRRGAMERLLDWGTPESLDAVLSRFTVVVQSPHWDEEEKRWLVEELAERGDVAKEALTRFLARENNIAFAAQALARMVSKDDYLEELLAALRARAPEDHRSVQAKQELILALGDADDPRGVEAIVPHLNDHADDVQCAAIDVVERYQAESAYTALADILCDDLRSGRVLRHAAGAVHRLKAPIDKTRALQPAVAEDFVVRDGTLAPAHENAEE